MHAWRPAFAAAVLALALAGCGDDEPPPFKTVSEPASTSTPSPTTTSAIDSPPVGELLSKLGPRTGAKLAPLRQAWAALGQRAVDVERASGDVQQIVEQIATGNAAPGGSADELAGLSQALASFGQALQPIAQQLLPQLSLELQARARRLDRSRPAVAAKLLEAQAQVDAAIGVVRRLQPQIADARAIVKKQQERESLDADDLHGAVTTGSGSATTALASTGDALERGLTALAAAA